MSSPRHSIQCAECRQIGGVAFQNNRAVVVQFVRHLTDVRVGPRRRVDLLVQEKMAAKRPGFNVEWFVAVARSNATRRGKNCFSVRAGRHPPRMGVHLPRRTLGSLPPGDMKNNRQPVFSVSARLGILDFATFKSSRQIVIRRNKTQGKLLPEHVLGENRKGGEPLCPGNTGTGIVSLPGRIARHNRQRRSRAARLACSCLNSSVMTIGTRS